MQAIEAACVVFICTEAGPGGVSKNRLRVWLSVLAVISANPGGDGWESNPVSLGIGVSSMRSHCDARRALFRRTGRNKDVRIAMPTAITPAPTAKAIQGRH